MARQARSKSETGIYHVMLRGNERKPVFVDEEDKNKFVEIMLQKKQGQASRLYAYCVLDNHVHMVIQEVDQPLERVMKRIGVTYAAYFNKKYKRIGHVFQDRFRSEAIEDESYLLSAIRYIHKNPVKLGGEGSVNYPWSSYPWYMGYMQNVALLPEMEDMLSQFSPDRQLALQRFGEFHQQDEQRRFLEVAETSKAAEDPQELVTGFLQSRQWSLEELCKNENQSVATELIQALIARSGISGRQIAHLTGINREKVRRMAVSMEPSP